MKSVYAQTLLLFLALGCFCPYGWADDDALFVIDHARVELRIKGEIHPRRYNRRASKDGGHHFIVWERGRNRRDALITTQVPDLKVLNLLRELGATPGDNLPRETWDHRADGDAPEPQMRTRGTKLSVSIAWNGETREMHEIFAGSDPDDFDFRVGGHESLIKVWRSGCITCLFSCPGGRVSNAAYTIRDQVTVARRFTASEDTLPPDGTEIAVTLRLHLTNTRSGDSKGKTGAGKP